MSNGSNTLVSSGPALQDFEEPLDPLGKVEVPLASQVPVLDLEDFREQALAAVEDPRE